MKMLRVVSVAAALFVSPVLQAQGSASIGQSASPGGVFYGGTVGVGFGDVDYFELSPMIGKHVTPTVAVGGTLIYRRRSDDRYSQKLTTNDYGGSVFGRYHVTPNVFAQAEYEYLNYEFYRLNLTKDSDSAHSVFLGGGLSSPLGRNSSVYATALYNVTHDDDSPYDSPWVIRFGVGVGF